MTLRDFLIIGAQKAGTTTLYRDLLENPTIFLPTDKEPGNLSAYGVLTDAGRSAYVTGAALGHIGSSSIREVLSVASGQPDLSRHTKRLT